MVSKLARSKARVDSARLDANEQSKRVAERGFSYERITKYFKAKGIESFSDLKKLNYGMVMDFLYYSRSKSEKATYKKLKRLDLLRIDNLVQNSLNETEFAQGLRTHPATSRMTDLQRTRLLGLYRHYKDVENTIRRAFMAREAVTRMTRKSLKAERKSLNDSEFGRETLKSAADGVRTVAKNLGPVWGSLAGLALVYGGYSLFSSGKDGSDGKQGFFKRTFGKLFKGLLWVGGIGLAANVVSQGFTKKSIATHIRGWLREKDLKKMFKKGAPETKAMMKIMSHEQMTQLGSLTAVVGGMPYVDVLNAYRQNRLPSGVLKTEMTSAQFRARMKAMDRVFAPGNGVAGGLSHLEVNHAKRDGAKTFAEVIGAGVYEKVDNPLGKNEGTRRAPQQRQILVALNNPLTYQSLPGPVLQRRSMQQRVRLGLGLTHPAHINAAMTMINKFIVQNNISISHAQLARFLASPPSLVGSVTMPGSGGWTYAKFRKHIHTKLMRSFRGRRPALNLRAGPGGTFYNPSLRPAMSNLTTVTATMSARPKFQKGLNAIFVAPLALAAAGDRNARIYVASLHNSFPATWRTAFGPVTGITNPTGRAGALPAAKAYLQKMVDFFKRNSATMHWISKGIVPTPENIKKAVLSGIPSKYRNKFDIRVNPHSPGSVLMKDPRNNRVFRVMATGANQWKIEGIQGMMLGKSLAECIRVMGWAMDVAYSHRKSKPKDQRKAFHVDDGTIEFDAAGWFITSLSAWEPNVDTSEVDAIGIKKEYLANLLSQYWQNYL